MLITESQKSSRLSVVQKTSIVVVAAVCAIAVALWIAFGIQADQEQQAEQRSRAQDQLVAVSAAHELQAIIDRRHHHLEIVTSSLHPTELQNPKELVRRYEELEPGAEVWVLDTSGRVVAATSAASLGRDDSSTPWYRSAIARGAAAVQEVGSDRTGGAHAVVQAIPLRESALQPSAGMLVTRIEMPALVRTLASETPVLTDVAIVLKTGTVLFRPPATQYRARCLNCHVAREAVDKLRGRTHGTIVHPRNVTSGQTFSFAVFTFAGKTAVLLLPGRESKPQVIGATYIRVVLLIAIVIVVVIGAAVVIYRAWREELRASLEASDWKDRSALESALRSAERHYRTIVDSSHDLIWILDSERRITYANPRMMAATGYSPEELIGRDIEEVVSLGGQPHVTEVLTGGVPSGEAEVNVTTKSGSKLVVELTLVAVDSAAGEAVVVCSAHDLTTRLAAEETAERREREYQQLVESVPGIVWSADAKTVAFTFVSEKAREILGYDTADWLGSPKFWLDHLHPEDREWAPAFCAAQTKLGLAHQFEYRMIAADGRVVWLHDVVNVAMENGEAKQLFGVMIDVTRSKNAEIATRESEARFRALFEQSPLGIAMRDSEDRVTHVNPAMSAMLGYSIEELFRTGISVLGHPDDIAAEPGSIEDLWSAGSTPQRFERRYRRKDGSWMWGRSIRSVVRDEDDRPLFRVGIIEDITQQKEAIEERRRLAIAIEHAGEAVIVTDASGVIEYVNPAFETITGFSRDEVLGRKPSILKSGMHDRDFYAGLWEKITAGQTWSGRVMNRRRDGTPYEAEATISPIFGESHDLTGFVAVQRDITQQVILLEKLRRAEENQSFGRLVSGVAHEVRNPLAAIQAALGALELDLSENAEHAQFFEIIRTQVERLTRLMRDMLDLAKPLQESRVGVHSLMDICASSLALWRHANRAEPLSRVEFRGATNASVRIDPTRMQQVIVNLIDNAVQHSKGETQVVVEIDEVGDECRIVVRDQGAGIAPQAKARLFEPFFTTRRGGTGLGLSLVRKIVEQHGGRVSLVSNDPPPGATAEIVLPTVTVHAEAPA